MSTFKLLVLILWWQISPLNAAGFRDSKPLFKDSKYVMSLTSETFNQMLSNPNEVWVVDFYAPWCPHCRDFAPELEKIAMHYKTSKIIRTGAIDCTVNEVICNSEEIMAYPAIKLFHVPPTAKVGKRYTQIRHKTMKNVVKWIEDNLNEANLMSGVPSSDIDSDIQNFVDDHHIEESHRAKYARLQDAGSAAIFTLEHSLFIGMTTLSGERFTAAVQWIEALAATFPLEQNRRVFKDLLQAVRQRERWDSSGWKSLIDKWKNIAKETTFPKSLLVYDEDATWAHCNTYTCGLWTLFHSMSVEAGLPSCTLQPSKVAAAIRLFVMHFFGCEECVRHFLRANPEHVIIELANADANRNNALVIWLWKMHNQVNKVTKKAFWPLPQICPECFTQPNVIQPFDPAFFDEDAIVAFVTRAYQQREEDVWKMNLQNNGIGAVIESFTGFWMVGLVIIFLLALVLLQNKTAIAFLKREHAA